jgi:hypothetical protein
MKRLLLGVSLSLLSVQCLPMQQDHQDHWHLNSALQSELHQSDILLSSNQDLRSSAVYQDNNDNLHDRALGIYH